MSYNGWMLRDDERARVLTMFPPAFAVVKASHITLDIRESGSLPIPRDAEIVIMGYAADDGVEALIVQVNGQTVRPDQSTYHMTLSVAEGRASKESNDVIAEKGVGSLDDKPGANFAGHELVLCTRGFLSWGDGRYITTPLSA